MEKNLIQDINNITKNLLLEDLFYGLFLSSLKKEERIDIPLAAVGLNKSTMDFTLFINPKEWFKLSQDVKKGIVQHETMHLTLFHLMNVDLFPNHRMDNIACDLEINFKIGKKNLPKWGCFLEDFKVKYPKLNWKEHGGRKHYYDELNKLSDEEKEQLGIDDRAKHKWIIVDGNGNPCGDLTEAERNAIRVQIQDRIEKIADEVCKANGSVSAEINELIAGFIKPKPKVNYKQYIRNFVSNSDKFLIKSSRLKENQRFIGQPKIVIKPLNKIVVYVDQSGSVNSKALEGFMNEIFHLKKQNDIVIYPFDTQVLREIKFKGDSVPRLLCGGTEPICCIEHFEKSNYYNAIIYTDGHFSPIRATHKNLLWVIDPTGTMKTTTNQQKVIKLPNE